MSEKNVQIPLILMNQIIALLSYLDVSNYDDGTRCEHEYVLTSLLEKRAKLELRKAYFDIILAKNEDARHSARMKYLDQKRSF